MAFKYILLPFSLIYYVVMSLRNLCYDRNIFRIHSLGVKVISVGNITWGGTGKTPAILYLAKRLCSQGHRVAILTRGYGEDEERLFSKLIPEVPVIVDKDRVRAGKTAIERYPIDTILLDDGFQYRRLKRDMDMVCIDATSPFGNNYIIPAGPLREGLGSLKRADIFLITKADLVKDQKGLQALENKLKGINCSALNAGAIHEFQYFYRLSDEQLVDIEFLKNKGKEIVLFSGIGNPVSFEKTVSGLGLKVNKHFIFRDHHRYKDSDFKKINDYCGKNRIDTMVTTEKDAVKLKAVSCQPSTTCPAPLWCGISLLVMNIKLKITDNEQAFHNRLSGVYNS